MACIFSSQVNNGLSVNSVILFLLCLFGKFLVLILYGNDFTQAYYIFLILAPGLLLDSIGRNVATWLKSEGKPLILSWISLGSLSFNILLNFILIPKYGLYGAAYSSLISYIARGTILWFTFKKYNGIKFSYIFLWSKAELIKIYSRIQSLIISFTR